MRSTHSRRRFLATLSSAAVGGLVGTRSRSLAQEGPSETTAIKLARSPSICLAPQYIAGELLRAEGFTDIRYVPADGGIGQSAGLASGEIDLTLHFAAPLIIPIDRGEQDHDRRRRACRLFRANCERASPRHPRPQG